MRRVLTVLLGAALAVAVAAPVAARSVVVPPSRATQSIAELAAANGNFTVLLAAVGCADPAVYAALTSGEQLTVFAPTDTAFENAGFDAESICDTSKISTELLTQVLLYHVEEGRHFSNSVVPKTGNAREIDTLLGQSFRVSSDLSIETSSGGSAHLVPPYVNLAATNGVIHVVDAVLMPQVDA